MDLSIYAFVGLIMLIGIVKKNAIMMIDFALDRQRNENMAPAEAIYQGALVRFRPIMMTTMAAIMGAVPIAIGWGAGAEARQPLGCRRGRRVDHFATFDAVYYPGGLSLHGKGPSAHGIAARAHARSGCGRRCCA